MFQLFRTPHVNSQGRNLQDHQRDIGGPEDTQPHLRDKIAGEGEQGKQAHGYEPDPEHGAHIEKRSFVGYNTVCP